MKKIVALLIAAFLTGGAFTSASAAELVIVSGSVKTIDGVVIPDLTVYLTGANGSTKVSTKVGSNGKFMLQVPEGDYSGYISTPSGSAGGICLNANIRRTLDRNNNTLDITLPRLMKYEFSFVNEFGDFVPGVSMVGMDLLFQKPANSETNAPYLSCNFAIPAFPRSTPVGGKISWSSLELVTPAASTSNRGQMTYSYTSGLGQKTTLAIPSDSWANEKITVLIKDIPQINLSAKSLKVSKSSLNGFATFTEASAFVGLGVERTLRTSVRVLRKGKWSPWTIQAGKTGTVDAKGQVSLNLPTKAYVGTSIEVVVSGVNFSAASQIVRIKVPK